jgi:ferredoxin
VKVVVDYTLCESNGFCVGVMPAVFELRDDDFLYLLHEDVPEADRPTLLRAVRQCPRQAISIRD